MEEGKKATGDREKRQKTKDKRQKEEKELTQRSTENHRDKSLRYSV
jgi:hypothetical protein